MKRYILGAVIGIFMLFPLTVIWISKSTNINTKEIQEAQKYLTGITKNAAPVKKADGKPFTIAFVDIDPYPASGEMLYYFVEQLKENGWIDYDKSMPFLPRNTDGRELVSWMEENAKSDYISFTKDQYYYLGVDGEDVCKEELQSAIDNKEVDLILCLGTWPGTFVKSLNNADIPVMVYFSVDPVGVGISKEDSYSGQDNLWCHVNYTVYSQQIQFYYDTAHFNKIGMIYYDESVGGMRAYRESAKKNAFSIYEKKIEQQKSNDKKQVQWYYENLENICNEMVENKIDAFMINTDIVKDVSMLPSLLDIFYKNKIPVFVQNGEYYVENGALMVVTASDAKEQAPFVADVFGRILSGESPGSINQIFITPPYLTLNLKTADKISYKVKEEFILSAEKIYTE